MTFKSTPLPGSYLIHFEQFKDDRGWFTKTFSKQEFKKIGFEGEWVEMNHSFSLTQGTIRGMHFQQPPYGEIKLVRCIRGKILDVIVDIRKNSVTFLKWFAIELAEHDLKMLYIPQGFAHGFQTLTDNTEVLYCHSERYTPAVESGILYKDPLLKIIWPIPLTKISERDSNHPELATNFNGI